jgi:hypothetical protein
MAVFLMSYSVETNYNVTVDFGEIGLATPTAMVRDVWAQTDKGIFIGDETRKWF